MNNFFLLCILCHFSLMSSFCSSENTRQKILKKTNVMAMYDLTKADEELILSKKLLEISGLTYIGNKKLAAVNDEEAWVYLIDATTGKITDKIDFGKKGDYEGITIVENDLYIVDSKGVIYKLKNYENNKKVKKYHTSFTVKNDMEGLCYYKKKHTLLILCKEQTGVKTHDKSWRYVYSFDLSEKKVLDEVFLKISEQEISNLLDKDMIGKFKPSGIAISPLDNNIFVLSSVGQALAIYSEKGTLMAAFHLSRRLFSQPEGITFDEKGNLYISNEGRKGRGNILIFEKKDEKNEYQKNKKQ